MPVIRRLLAHRRFAALICAAAMLLRLVVPSGYMIGSDHGRLAITICPGISGPTMTMAGMGAVMPGHGKEDHGRAEMPCPFASLAAPALGGAAPVLLAVLVAFVMATGLRPIASRAPRHRAFSRPPLRGPPLHP